MEGAEAGRRERWRKEGEMRGNKTTLDSRKLMMSHTNHSVHMSMHFEFTKIIMYTVHAAVKNKTQLYNILY